MILVHEHETMKHRIVHFLQKYLFNPPIKFLFAIGLVPPGYGLLETTGRKTGKPRRTPVGNGLVARQFWIVAEHGQKAGYVRNIVGNPRVRLKLRDGLRARWYTGTANLLSDDDPRERQRPVPMHCALIVGAKPKTGLSLQQTLGRADRQGVINAVTVHVDFKFPITRTCRAVTLTTRS